jgi:protein-S-isoprenylcysteine O-methyltransferase Ste14
VLYRALVAGLVPWWISRWHMQPPFLGLSLFRLAGAALIALGTPALLDSFVRFALQGLGTPAPVFPTRHLVVTGLYRYVRSRVCRSCFRDSRPGAASGERPRAGLRGAVWLAFSLFVIGYEEPTLRRTFGIEYERFWVNVPRWLPRFRPWSRQ